MADQMSYLGALRQIEHKQPGGDLWVESTQAVDEWEVTPVTQVIDEIEREALEGGADVGAYEVIVEWSDGVAYLTPMDERGYRIHEFDVADRVKWEA